MDEIPTPPPTPPVLFIPPVPPRKDKIVRNSQLLVNSSEIPIEDVNLTNSNNIQLNTSNEIPNSSFSQPDYSKLEKSPRGNTTDTNPSPRKQKNKKEKKKTKFPIGTPQLHIRAPFKTILRKMDIISTPGEGISGSAPPIPPPPPPVQFDLANNVRFSVKVNSLQFDTIDLDQRTRDLIDLLVGPNMLICKSLLSIATTRNIKFLWKAIPSLFVYGGRSNDLLSPFIREEVHRTEDKSTLFRGSDWCSKLISAVSSLLGSDFLIQSLSAPCKQLQEMLDNEYYFEVNPMNCDPAILPQNINNLLTICYSFLNSVITYCESLPKTLKNICKQLREETSDKFPDSKDFIIGGFFFLRFICPAIVAPQSFNIIDPAAPMSPAFRRALILVSKILQNLSNGVEFGKKEEYMSPFNEFIHNNLSQVSQLFDYYSYEDNLCPNDELISFEIDLNLIEDVVYFICQNKGLVISEILQFTNVHFIFHTCYCRDLTNHQQKDIPLLESEIERINHFASVYNNY